MFLSAGAKSVSLDVASTLSVTWISFRLVHEVNLRHVRVIREASCNSVLQHLVRREPAAGLHRGRGHLLVNSSHATVACWTPHQIRSVVRVVVPAVPVVPDLRDTEKSDPTQ